MLKNSLQKIFKCCNQGCYSQGDQQRGGNPLLTSTFTNGKRIADCAFVTCSMNVVRPSVYNVCTTGKRRKKAVTITLRGLFCVEIMRKPKSCIHCFCGY